MRMVVAAAGLAALSMFSAPAMPAVSARLFVGQCAAHKIAILAPPFIAPPAAVDAIPQRCTNGIAFNPVSGILAAASGPVFGTGTIELYRPPYTGNSVSFATLRIAGAGDLRQIAWDSTGNLWVAQEKIYGFRPPFSNASRPFAVNALPVEAAGLAIDRNARLMFIGDMGGAKRCGLVACRLFVVPAPYTGSASATFTFANSTPTAIAIDPRGRLFVAFDAGDLAGKIAVYLPPFRSDQIPAFEIDPGGAVESLAFDSGQNLYGQLYATGGIVVFNGPISGRMDAPSKILGCLSGFPCVVKNWSGIAFGP
jgi:hypothetical protein